MNRYGRTGLRVLGGLLALVLAATLLPAAVYAAGGAYQVDEDSVYMNMEDSRPAALAAQASMAAADNVAMHLFNYTGNINGQGPLEFYHSWGASVDGDASGSGARPSMSPTLEDNKWPYVTGIPGSKASGSLGYLFSDSAVPGKTVYSVGRGGSTGLFQRDSKGYLYYDSLRNAASYDAASGRFQLYDGIVRPWYTGYVEPDGKTVFDDRTIAFNGNFLPFNDLTGATEAPRGRSPAAYRLPDGKVDLWFGMSMSFDFYMPADGKINGEDMIFQFLGDDDVFVYIDGVLVLDIGGTHGANSGSINFATGDVTHPREGVAGAAEADDYVTTTLAKKFQTAGMTGSFDGSTFGDYTKHTLQFFYLERGGNVSYCYLRFNTPTLPNNSLTVAKELSGGEQELNRYLAGAMDYRFRVLRPDGSLYVPEGTAYQLLENSTAVGSGAVGADGYFTLKAGQMAQFTDMLTLGGGSYDYLVEETMPDRLTGQYRQVQYTVGSGTGTTVSPTAEEDFTGFRTDTLTAAATQLVTYRNVVDTSALGELRVTKQVAEGSDAAAGRAFDIGVALGGEANTTYGENTGVLALSKIYDPLVIRIAAVLAIILSFSPKFEAVINTIPTGIIGGISFVLYGMISAIGVRNVVENRVDFTNSRNLIVAAVILVCALGFNSVGGVSFAVAGVTINLSGLAVAAIAGILLNAILPGNDYEFDAADGSEAATSSNLQV